MYSTSEFRRGLKIEIDGEPFTIQEFQHVKPGKGGAFVRTKMKSLITGNVIDRTFKSGDKVDRPDMAEKEMQYLYQDGDNFYFMDNETYDQQFINIEQFQGAVELPNFVELTVKQTDPGFKGDTASGATKPATLETGATIQVPLFIKEGEKIRIDTRTGEYAERVK